MSANELFSAIKDGDADRVGSILQQQPSLADSIDENGRSVLQTAVMYGCNKRSKSTRPIVQELLKVLPLVSLGDASMLGDEVTLKARILEGADLNATDTRVWTALHWAADVGEEGCARLLLEAGADPNAVSGHGPPLERASHPGPNKPTACQPIIDLLLEHGATVTPHLAAMLGDEERLRQFIEQNPSAVHERDQRGATPLYHAAHNLHLACVELLLAHGADANAKLDDGQTALSTAIDHRWDRGGEAVVERLMRDQ